MRAVKTETTCQDLWIISEKLHVCCRCGGLSAGADHDSARLIGQHEQPVIKTHTWNRLCGRLTTRLEIATPQREESSKLQRETTSLKQEKTAWKWPQDRNCCLETSSELIYFLHHIYKEMKDNKIRTKRQQHQQPDNRTILAQHSRWILKTSSGNMDKLFFYFYCLANLISLLYWSLLEHCWGISPQYFKKNITFKRSWNCFSEVWPWNISKFYRTLLSAAKTCQKCGHMFGHRRDLPKELWQHPRETTTLYGGQYFPWFTQAFLGSSTI